MTELADDESVNGILLQLPLPANLDERSALKKIPVEKDVDGFSEENVGKLAMNRGGIAACTPLGVMKMLESAGTEICGKRAVVIDADGLNALSRIENIANMLHDKAVLTPHIGEMARLTGLSTAYIKENQAEVAAKYAKQWGCTVLLKSYRSVIACHDGRIALNTNGNSGLAKGGSGDVLSGITLAMLSQGLDTFGAACAGAYTLGASAEEAMALLKERMLMARDVTDAVEQTVNKLFE